MDKKAMKLALLALSMIVVSAPGRLAAADHAFVSVGMGYLQPADSGYKEIYGSQVFYPDVRAGVRLVRGLYVVGGFATFTKNGETPDLHLAAKSTQSFFTAGLAYLATVSGQLKFKAEAGAAEVRYKEEAMGLAVSGSKLGFEAGMGLLVMGRMAFAGADLGYLSATDTVEGVRIKLGGARASLYIGVRI